MKELFNQQPYALDLWYRINLNIIYIITLHSINIHVHSYQNYTCIEVTECGS